MDVQRANKAWYVGSRSEVGVARDGGEVTHRHARPTHRLPAHHIYSVCVFSSLSFWAAVNTVRYEVGAPARVIQKEVGHRSNTSNFSL